MKPRLLSHLALALALLVPVASLRAAEPPHKGPVLGLQTWTCRSLTFEQVLDFAAQHGIKQIEFIATQLDPTAPREESLRKKALLEQRGLTAYTFGVNQVNAPGQARPLFEFAKLMGMKLIIVEPDNKPEIWDDLEALVREFDIKLAIHNHGTGTRYGDPATVKKILAARDPRIGVCLDLGWVTAAGFDAAKVFHDYDGRVFDMHFKDKVTRTGPDGKVTAVDTEIGQGSVNYAGVFAEIRQSKWSGVMAIEVDSKSIADNPGPFVDHAARFFAAQTQGVH